MLAQQTTEADWRGAAIHAYYALFLECREALVRWGRPVVGRHNIHPAVRLKFTYSASPDLKRLSNFLDDLLDLRTHASYDLSVQARFSTATDAQKAIQTSADGISLLDAIDADPNRRAAAIASLPP
jgi:hypothetical protein